MTVLTSYLVLVIAKLTNTGEKKRLLSPRAPLY
jgi:hypothetical protein